MSDGTGPRRRRRRRPLGKVEIWLGSSLIGLVCLAVLGLGRSLQTSIRPAGTPGALRQPAPVGFPAAQQAHVDRAGSMAVIRRIWGDHWALGVSIARCESALEADAVHTGNPDGSVDVGLFQINSIHGWSQAELLDPSANTQFAYTLYQTYGTAPWESSRACWDG